MGSLILFPVVTSLKFYLSETVQFALFTVWSIRVILKSQMESIVLGSKFYLSDESIAISSVKYVDCCKHWLAELGTYDVQNFVYRCLDSLSCMTCLLVSRATDGMDFTSGEPLDVS